MTIVGAGRGIEVRPARRARRMVQGL